MDRSRGSNASLRGGTDGRIPGPEPVELALQPVVDLRGPSFRLAGFSCALPIASPSGLTPVARVVRALAEAIEAAEGLDLFVTFEGLAGTAAATILPSMLNGAEAEGLPIDRLIVDLGGPFPEPLAGDDILETIESTRGRGVRVSISRAGLSESGLEMLLGTRPDYLRVAASLVSGCGNDFYRQAIVETIAGLAWKFGAGVLAEGLLDEQDARWLATAGIALATGRFFGEPVALESVRSVLGRRPLPFDPGPFPSGALSTAVVSTDGASEEEP